MSTCPECNDDTGCTCEEHDRIKELEEELRKTELHSDARYERMTTAEAKCAELEEERDKFADQVQDMQSRPDYDNGYHFASMMAKDKIEDLEANLTKQAEVNCGLVNEVARWRGAFNLACSELEAYLGYCPIEQEKVPWDCDKKCTVVPEDCAAKCWGDWFMHKQALEEQA